MGTCMVYWLYNIHTHTHTHTHMNVLEESKDGVIKAVTQYFKKLCNKKLCSSTFFFFNLGVICCV